MTTEAPSAGTPDASQEAVKLRSPRHIWVGFIGFGGFCLVLAGLYLWLRPLFGVLYLVTGCAAVAVALYIRSRGMDLTRESAVVCGIRRRSIPWAEVQAVIAVREGVWHVQLILASGESVALRAPRSDVGLATARYERDFHRIGQWWLAHRGESWRPVLPEAPRLTVQR